MEQRDNYGPFYEQRFVARSVAGTLLRHVILPGILLGFAGYGAWEVFFGD